MVEGNGDLVGIVTGRDTRFEDDDSKEIRHVMTGNDRPGNCARNSRKRRNSSAYAQTPY